eukprot:6040768-Pyramimonas_sp.AAC.1
MMKGVLNNAQRQRAVEGCLVSTHLLPKERNINLAAIGAAQKYSDTVKDKPADHGLGPPSLQVSLAVLELLINREVLNQNPNLQEHVQSVTKLIQH